MKRWTACRRLGSGWLIAAVAVVGCAARLGAQVQAVPKTPVELVRAMVAKEDAEAAHRQVYGYMAKERSERTGGQMWTERVVQTSVGRVRRLMEVDGKPLDAAAERAERERLEAIVADPRAFEAKEASERSDEANARKMMDMLPAAFLFEHVRLEDGVWKMDYRPNPAYTPHGLQERVLYGMSGRLEIDARQERLMRIEGRLAQDVSIGFGILATVHAGSYFVSERREVDGHWRTVHVVSAIEGKAALFKALSRNTDVTRWEFRYLDPGTTVAQAVAMVESSGGVAAMGAARTAGE
ncbi:MAG: hypothetical protein HIU91_15495 [Acidobacteria bacterium]|nr:hypothetical protein [Acidobacteriota bacterium]